MNTLIIYDSKYGNTEQIAQVIGSALEVYASVRVLSVDEVATAELSTKDLLVLGCPTQNHKLSPGMKSFLDRLPDGLLKDVRVAVFDTRFAMSSWVSGSAAEIIGRLARKKGGVLITQPKSFFVNDKQGPLKEGELSRAAEWAELLLLEHKAILA
jgi:flavodoxin